MKRLVKSIGIILFLLIILKLDFHRLAAVLKTVDVPILIVGLMLCVPLLVLKALRWHAFLAQIGIRIKRMEAIILYASGLFLGPSTPGRVGEFIRVFYLKDQGYALGTVFYTAFIDRYVDLVGLLFITLLGMFFDLPTFQVFVIPFLATFLGCLIFLILLYRRDSWVERPAKRMISKILPGRLYALLDRVYEDFQSGLKTFNTQTMLGSIAVTLFCWGIYFFEVMLFARALKLDLPFLYLTAVTGVAAGIGLLPITVFGLGTRDAVLFFFLQQRGVSLEGAEALSLTILLWNLLIVAICFPAWQQAAHRYHLDEVLTRLKHTKKFS